MGGENSPWFLVAGGDTANRGGGSLRLEGNARGSPLVCFSQVSLRTNSTCETVGRRRGSCDQQAVMMFPNSAGVPSGTFSYRSSRTIFSGNSRSLNETNGILFDAISKSNMPKL